MAVKDLLADIQAGLLKQATEFRDSNIHDVATYDELRQVVEAGGWARAWWAGSDDDERRVKDETGASLRCFPFDQAGDGGSCVLTGNAASEQALFARAY